MIYLVESIDVDPSDTSRYLEAFERKYLPGAKQRGMKFIACWHTPENIGEDVTVTSIFEVRDWAHWDELRKQAFLDPSMPEWLEIRAQLAKGGKRRFYSPAEFSPLR